MFSQENISACTTLHAVFLTYVYIEINMHKVIGGQKQVLVFVIGQVIKGQFYRQEVDLLNVVIVWSAVLLIRMNFDYFIDWTLHSDRCI